MASWTLTVIATIALSAGIVVANHHATGATPTTSPATTAVAPPTAAAASPTSPSALVRPATIVSRTYRGDDGESGGTPSGDQGATSSGSTILASGDN